MFYNCEYCPKLYFISTDFPQRSVGRTGRRTWLDPDQEYIYFMGSKNFVLPVTHFPTNLVYPLLPVTYFPTNLVYPSACHILSDESSIPFTCYILSDESSIPFTLQAGKHPIWSIFKNGLNHNLTFSPFTANSPDPIGLLKVLVLIWRKWQYLSIGVLLVPIGILNRFQILRLCTIL